MTQRVIFADGCHQIDVGAVRYYARGASAFEGTVKGGVFEMSDAAAKLAVQAGGAIASLAGTVGRSSGFRCQACGFGSFVRTCGRCGAECVRE